MKSAVLPTPDGPKVKFENDQPPDPAVAPDMDNIPEEVMRAPV